MCDCFYPEVFSNRLVKARKPYKCCECGSDIAAGEKYHSIFGVWDHDPGSYRVCADCEVVREWLLKLDLPDADCCLGTYGNLHCELVEFGLVSFEEGQLVEIVEGLELLYCQENAWKVKVRDVTSFGLVPKTFMEIQR